MRLSDFILANVEPILMEWEEFARSIWPGEAASPRILRNHAPAILIAVAHDMQESQTDSQQTEKSKGQRGSAEIDKASLLHAISRVESGFDLRQVVAEFRALRASVLHLWSLSGEREDDSQIGDMTRFNESIDQFLSESIVNYAQHVDQSREIFLGILGHDLRGPLHAVTMIADLLEKHGNLEGLTLKMASQMATSARAMGQLIADLLDFTGARLGAKMAVHPSAMDLETLCQEVLVEMEAVHPTRSFTFERQGEVRGSWDSARLRQLISNLLGNAVQHGFPATPIGLSIRAGGNELVLEVRNQGASIPQDSLALIFEPMRRSSGQQLSRPPGSIGLGLYIAREVATAHGGSIDVRSVEEETVFSVRLPR